MKSDERSHDFDALDPLLQAAVAAVVAEPLPEDAVARVQLRAQCLAAASPTTHAALAKRLKFFPSLAGGCAAAALLAAVVATFALMQERPGGQVFAQMLENIRTVDTVQFHATIKLGKHVSEDSYFMEGNKSRSVRDDGSWTTIADLDRRRILILDKRNMRYQWSNFDGMQAQELANPIDKLRRITAPDAEFVRDEFVEGRRAEVYRMNGAELFLGAGPDDYLETIVWIDVDSGLPVKISAQGPYGNLQVDIALEEFVWDEPLDPELFSLEPPAGFVLIEDPAGPWPATPVTQ